MAAPEDRKAEHRASSIERLRRLIYYIFGVNLLIFASAWGKTVELPDSAQVVAEVLEDPQQQEISVEPFIFEFMGHRYKVSPQATYQISGLVVSRNNPQGWVDIYHDSSSVDIRDLCLIWGDNTQANLQQDMIFSSNTWVCSYRGKDFESFKKFRGDQLSNNHLLARRADVQAKILDTEIGDQVLMRGLLVDYAPLEHPELVRPTSLVRDDTGNGACEVFFVEEFIVLKKANQSWRMVYLASKYLLLAFLFLMPAAFLYSVYTEQRGRAQVYEETYRRRRKTLRDRRSGKS